MVISFVLFCIVVAFGSVYINSQIVVGEVEYNWFVILIITIVVCYINVEFVLVITYSSCGCGGGCGVCASSFWLVCVCFVVFVVHSPGGLGWFIGTYFGVDVMVIAGLCVLLYLVGANWFRCCCLMFVSVVIHGIYVVGWGGVVCLIFNNIKYITFSIVIMSVTLNIQMSYEWMNNSESIL